MKKIIIFLSLVLIAFFSSIGTTSAKQILFEDNFNGTNITGGSDLNYDTFAQWTVKDGTVDIIGEETSWNFFPTAGYGQYIDLDGTTFDAGVMISKAVFDFKAGYEYELSFDLAGSHRGDSNTVLVSLGNAFTETFTVNSSDPFETISRTFVIKDFAQVNLTFSNLGGDNIGSLLDNVMLTESAPAPEPATLFLLGSGIVAIGLRKKFVK